MLELYFVSTVVWRCCGGLCAYVLRWRGLRWLLLRDAGRRERYCRTSVMLAPSLLVWGRQRGILLAAVFLRVQGHSTSRSESAFRPRTRTTYYDTGISSSPCIDRGLK